MNKLCFPPHSSLQTPHSEYHWDGIKPKYFEGWYYRLTLPKLEQVFAFMYSIEDPIGDQANSGGAIQIIGIDETYLYRLFPDVKSFFAAYDNLNFGHWGKTNLQLSPKPLNSRNFADSIAEGYQASATLNQGSIYDPVKNEYCRWEYQIKPIYGWGNSTQCQKATAGFLSYLSIFDPGWQITMAHGLATGWVEWQSKCYKFVDVPAYSEKNWGCSFPQKWFWLNCNSFEQESDLALTAGGGIRQVLWWQESVALIGIHHHGTFYEFAPWNSEVSWQIDPWGYWYMEAKSVDFNVILEGTTNSLGTYVRTPTAKGLVFNCRDTTQGKLKLKLFSHTGTIIVKAISNLAGLEIGGGPWDQTWVV